MTVSATLCSNDDISYTFAASGDSGQGVGFIAYDPDTDTVTWQNSGATIGVYTIQRTGTINAVTTWTRIDSFELTVNDCANEDWALTITTGGSPLDQSYMTN